MAFFKYCPECRAYHDPRAHEPRQRLIRNDIQSARITDLVDVIQEQVQDYLFSLPPLLQRNPDKVDLLEMELPG